jgi:DNA-binding beta-propeller fold protein YncE
MGYEDGVLAQARFNCPTAIAADNAGNLYVADTLNNCIRLINKNGMVSTVKGTRNFFDCPSGVAVTEDGSVIFVSDTGNNRVCKIEDGKITVLANINLPVGIAYADGVLFVAESGGHMIKAITETGLVMTLAGNGEPGDADGASNEARLNMPKGVCVSEGVLYIADTGNNKIKQMTLDENLFTGGGQY